MRMGRTQSARWDGSTVLAALPFADCPLPIRRLTTRSWLSGLEVHSHAERDGRRRGRCAGKYGKPNGICQSGWGVYGNARQYRKSEQYTKTRNVLPTNELKAGLLLRRKSVLVTGAAGFIGSNLLNFGSSYSVGSAWQLSPGTHRNLTEVRNLVSAANGRGPVCRRGYVHRIVCGDACAKVAYVLHQAALGRYPRSNYANPGTHAANDGFLNMLGAAGMRSAASRVRFEHARFYGDDPIFRSVGSQAAASPYAASKAMDKFTLTYLVGLRIQFSSAGAILMCRAAPLP